MLRSTWLLLLLAACAADPAAAPKQAPGGGGKADGAEPARSDPVVLVWKSPVNVIVGSLPSALPPPVVDDGSDGEVAQAVRIVTARRLRSMARAICSARATMRHVISGS